MLPVKLLRIPIFAAIACAAFAQTPPLPASVRFLPGPANGLLVNGKVLVYGDPGGTVNIADLMAGSSDEESGGMVSFNHYAAGAVGDWMYRRIAGLEPTSGGYRTFRVAPLVGGGLTSARASMRSCVSIAPAVTSERSRMSSGSVTS